MKLHTLKPAAGSTHSRRRIGRGPGSGLGGTSTRGHKGAKARSGYNVCNFMITSDFKCYYLTISTRWCTLRTIPRLLGVSSISTT